MISVVVPTRNCAREMDSHLESLKAIKNIVQEFIFVDSFSEDGTAEKIADFLRSGIPGVLLSCPPGLYAAWNQGATAAKGFWVTFATVGDTQTSEGLRHLMEVGEKLSADLIVSPPLMMEGRSNLEVSWPIHRLATTKQSPNLLTQAECLRWLCGFLPGTVLGSAASNLYRREFLLDHPFPTHFGHEGDVAWGLQVAKTVRMAVTPSPCAKFQVHERASKLTAQEQFARFEQLTELARATLDDQPEFLAEFQVHWEREQTLWRWINALEGLAETMEEQKKYINILENKNATLLEENQALSRLPVGLPLPFFKTGTFLAAHRFLKRIFYSK